MNDLNQFHAELPDEQYAETSDFDNSAAWTTKDVQEAIEKIATLKRELTAVTEQRDDYLTELQIVTEILKGKRHPDDNDIMADGEIDVKALIEQRDRLAEALHKVSRSWNYVEVAREALQSLTNPNEL
jgi:hypothetical protein